MKKKVPGTSAVFRGIRKISLVMRLALLIGCAIILPNIVLLVHFNREADRQFTQNTITYYQNVLSNVEKNYWQQISLVEAAVWKIAADPELPDLLSLPEDSADGQARLKQRYDQLPEGIRPYVINLMFLIDGKQYGISNAIPACDMEKLAAKAYYQEAIESTLQPVWATYARSEEIYRYSESPSIVLGDCLTLMMGVLYGTQSGVLLLNLNPTYFESLYKNNSINEEVFYLDCRESFAFPLQGNAVISTEVYDYIHSADFSDASGYRHVSIGKDSYLILHHGIMQPGWNLVTVIKADAAFQSVASVREKTAQVTLLVLGISVLITVVIAVSFSLPLKRLTRAVAQVGQDNLHMEYSDNSGDEIGQLSQAFQQMLARIQKLTETKIRIEAAQKDEQIKRKRFELEALQMKIKPHFLYNTLDIIRWNSLKIEKQAGETTQSVSRMVFLLSRNLAYGVKTNEQFVSIGDEIRHASVYLELLQYTKHWNVRLKLSMQAKRFQNASIVPLTLQPIIENAVLHGLPRTEKKQVIRLHIRPVGTGLLLSVIDFGQGMDKQTLARLNESFVGDGLPGHVGLNNVDARLKLFFGEDSGLTVRSKEGVFTSVTIWLPLEGLENI